MFHIWFQNYICSRSWGLSKNKKGNSDLCVMLCQYIVKTNRHLWTPERSNCFMCPKGDERYHSWIQDVFKLNHEPKEQIFEHLQPGHSFLPPILGLWQAQSTCANFCCSFMDILGQPQGTVFCSCCQAAYTRCLCMSLTLDSRIYSTPQFEAGWRYAIHTLIIHERTDFVVVSGTILVALQVFSLHNSQFLHTFKLYVSSMGPFL